LVSITTNNQPDTIQRLLEVNDSGIVRWDCSRGLRGLNDAGVGWVNLVTAGDIPPEATGDLMLALQLCEKISEPMVVFLLNAHRFVKDERNSTAIGNLRETFKATGSTLVLLGPDMDLPLELVSDVIRLSDPIPDDDQLASILAFVEEQVAKQGIKLQPFTDEEREQTVSALRGLSSFTAEQQAFLSLRRTDDGSMLRLDITSLWERKMQSINAIDGLTMRFQKTDINDIRGLDALLDSLSRRFRPENPNRPQVIFHIDEIDKGLAASGGEGVGDSSGVAQDQLNVFLTTMENKGWNGYIAFGPPGCGKTFVATMIAGVYGIPYICLDLGALKGSLVGESEAKIRYAIETVDRIGNGRVFVIATCNKMEALKIELRRRFKAGIYYFESPDQKARENILDLYIEKFGVEVSGAEVDALIKEPLTGAEIRNICETMRDLDVSAAEARALIVPVYLSGADQIERVRRDANGRFLDAARGGTYTLDKGTVAAAPARKIGV
jgi:hypothetical protein